MSRTPPIAARGRAAAVLVLFASTLAVGIVLVAAFEPEIQTLGAADLVSQRDDARAFLAADYVFVALYAVLSPLVIWRFGRAIGSGSPPRWIGLAAALLLGAGLVDATENTLLLSATDSVSRDAVDAAHALEIPKVLLFLSGTLLALAVNVRAAGTLRRR